MIKKSFITILLGLFFSCQEKIDKSDELKLTEYKKMVEAVQKVAINTHLELVKLKEENSLLRLKIDSLETMIAR